ncbi:hypothetical protein BDK51DRAFT_38934 [Blyttiomyces helicus]|uniref:FERM domain-containing protein n=1 Tax=Blyttiomyces helicus TaxID=388810 RepID=A0A4P9W954_9FUNG|nr:hypothetical protein BDK51DRAFT_38934 [Blyttiomyces helicus]|eukprot:RKO88682.1 hypothetical protein BDK51DRAFT_38934 [Blyttiomyces helicus]
MPLSSYASSNKVFAADPQQGPANPKPAQAVQKTSSNEALSRRSPAKQALKGPDTAREALWTPPLQRHVHPDGRCEFVTIRVRVLSGDAEHDCNAKFDEGPLPAKLVCNAIAAKEGLSPEGAKLFSLWIISRDLGESELRWSGTWCPARWEQALPNQMHGQLIHPTDHARVAIETGLGHLSYDDKVAQIAKRNLLRGRYLLDRDDIVKLAGLQAHLVIGEYDPLRHPRGYLA